MTEAACKLNSGDIASPNAALIGALDTFPGMTLGTKQLRPESHGSVRIRSADDRDAPILQPNYLDDERDRVKALKWARALLTSRPLERILKTETLPGPQVSTDDEWLDFARRSANSSYHLIGTAKMGPATDRMAVVDARLKVHGMEGLYVADCSIMPNMPSGNTFASALLIGEKCADMLLKKELPTAACVLPDATRTSHGRKQGRFPIYPNRLRIKCSLSSQGRINDDLPAPALRQLWSTSGTHDA